MSDNITKARTFLKSFLDNNGGGLSESSVVLAMIDYADASGFHDEGELPIVTETAEFKDLSDKYSSLNEDYLKAVHQRDHNWNELQKALNEIKSLKTPVVTTIKPVAKVTTAISGSNSEA